jgi:hypothetical protein
MNFRNHLVNLLSSLAFAGVILAGFPTAAGEDVEESAPSKLSIAAVADVKFHWIR